MEPIKSPAILDGVSPLKDGGMSVRFHTQEMGAAEKARLMDYYQQFGWMLFAPQERDITEEDIPDEKASGPYEGKTPSQRLRSSLYVLWKQGDQPTGDFELWYRQQMERLILKVQERLS